MEKIDETFQQFEEDMDMLTRYAEFNLDHDIQILGCDHPFEILELTIGEIRDRLYRIKRFMKKWNGEEQTNEPLSSNRQTKSKI